MIMAFPLQAVDALAGTGTLESCDSIQFLLAEVADLLR